jgi:hypothetical protein
VTTLKLALIVALCAGCTASRPERVVLSQGSVVPATLARRSRLDLSDYFARTTSVVDSGTSISILARIVDRSYVLAAERERARSGRWPAARAQQELAQAEAYYLTGRLSFEVEVEAAIESGLGAERFGDIAGWQWTLVVDGGEPLVAADATTTRKRRWREQGGVEYFQGRAGVRFPEPTYLIDHHSIRGVVRFGPPPPAPGRAVTLRAYPPGLPAVLRLRWRVARDARGA